MRIAVVGTSGSGKTTLARRLGARIGAPVIELDALNWGPDWTNRSRADPSTLMDSVEAATSGESWVADGNYRLVQSHILARATDVIWLDYSRATIMRRVVARSVERALSGAELWTGTGNRESWRRWLDKEHPVRWAWDTHSANRRRYEALFVAPDTTHLTVHKLQRPREAARLLQTFPITRQPLVPPNPKLLDITVSSD